MIIMLAVVQALQCHMAFFATLTLRLELTFYGQEAEAIPHSTTDSNTRQYNTGPHPCCACYAPAVRLIQGSHAPQLLGSAHAFNFTGGIYSRGAPGNRTRDTYWNYCDHPIESRAASATRCSALPCHANAPSPCVCWCAAAAAKAGGSGGGLALQLLLLCCWWPAGGLAGIVRQEGFKGLYRGLTPTLMALLPNWAVSTCSCLHTLLSPCYFFRALWLRVSRLMKHVTHMDTCSSVYMPPAAPLSRGRQ